MADAVLLSSLSPNNAPSQLAVLADDSGLLLAIGSGNCACIHSVQLGAVQQILGPHEEPVSCLRWCRSHMLLAVGVGRTVVIYAGMRGMPGEHTITKVAEAYHDEPVSAVEWSSLDGKPVLWTSGRTLVLWRAAENSKLWTVMWRCDLPQKVRLMSASADGKLIATAGAHDRLLKVWTLHSDQNQMEGGGERVPDNLDISFCYLRHSSSLRSFEWRPSAARRGSGEDSVLNSQLGCDRSILLSLCVDGVARLWTVTDTADGSVVSICATLGLEGLISRGLPPQSEMSCQRFQLVQWLQPTSLPSFVSDCSVSAGSLFVSPDSPSTSLSLLGSPQLTPLFKGGLPTLRPSLRERHDYIVAILADGTLVVWLLLGLSSVPRVSPKIVVFANLPNAVPRADCIRASTVFCHFQSTSKNGVFSAHAEDTLPSAVSMVQHVVDHSSFVRLCTVDVDRATCGDRMHMHTLHGHCALSNVRLLIPHPSLPLLASIASNGELAVWECAFPPAPPGSKSAADHLTPCGQPLLPEIESDMVFGGPRWRQQFPGKYGAAVWISNGPLLLVAESRHLDLFRRARHGESSSIAWEHISRLSLGGLQEAYPDTLMTTNASVESTDSHASERPLSLISFHSSIPSAEHGGTIENAGFVLGCKCNIGVWTLSETGTADSSSRALSLRWIGYGSLAHGPGEVKCYAAVALPALTRRAMRPTLPGGGYGSLAAAYSDCRVIIWTVTVSTSGVLELTPDSSLTLQFEPERTLIDVSAICASPLGESLRVALISHTRPRSRNLAQRHGSAAQLHVLEFESHANIPHEEFRLLVETQALDAIATSMPNGSAGACSFTTLAGGVLVLAVTASKGVQLFTRSRSSLLGARQASWELCGVLPPPGTGACSAVAWLCGGVLLANVGAQLALWPTVQFSALKSGEGPLCPIAEWHPAVLKLYLLSGDTCDVVLRHLSESSSLQDVHAIKLIQLIPTSETCGQDVAPSAPDMDASNQLCVAELEDMFAPTTGPSDAEMDFWGPTEPSQLEEKFSAHEFTTTRENRSMVKRLLERLKTGMEVPPTLNEPEMRDLAQLLETLETLEGAAAALDQCGVRFLVLALDQRQSENEPCVNSVALAWALLSSCQTTLLDLCLSRITSKTWAAMRFFGVGFWLPQGDALKAAIEDVAKFQFTREQNPEHCALLYLALGKKKQLQALCKAVRNERLYNFLSNDFSESRWRSAATKNAYVLMSKQQHELAAAFFLLAGDIQSSVKVCARQLGDLQLALVLCRLHSDAAPKLLHDTVCEELLKAARAHGDRWLHCVACLILNDAQGAIAALAGEESPALSTEHDETSRSWRGENPLTTLDACAATFCSVVASSPRFKLPPQQLPCGLFLRCAHSFRQAGMVVAGLEALNCARRDKMVDRVELLMLRAVAELLLQRAEQFLAMSDVSKSIMTPSQYAQAVTSAAEFLREDVKVITKHYSIPKHALAEHLSRKVDAVESQIIAPCIAVFFALDLLGPLAQLTSYASISLVSSAWSSAPHLLRLPLCTQVLRASSIVCGCYLLLSKALDEESAQTRNDLLAVFLSLYAVCASLQRFDVILKLVGATLTPESIEASGCWEILAPLVDQNEGASQGSECDDGVIVFAREYSWARLHMLFFGHLRVAISSLPSKSRGNRALSIYLPERFAAPSLGIAEPLVGYWLVLARASARDLAARLPASAFPVDPKVLARDSDQSSAATELWVHLSREAMDVAGEAIAKEHIRNSGSADNLSSTAVIGPEPVIWPRDDEYPGVLEVSNAQTGRQTLNVSPALELLQRRGDFVRCVCVNALNHRQLAVSLSKGVHQIEITDQVQPMVSDNSHNQWSAFGPKGGVTKQVHKTHLLRQSSASSTHSSGKSLLQTEFCVQESIGNDTAARCLCSHPKCWQFGQTIQGRGLHDHLRSQYKLPSSDRVTSMKISPCGEQFASVDANGFLCIWRFAGFQSGSEMPLPSLRLRCHTRRGADLCFVGSSSVLTSVGLSANAGNHDSSSLCLWDVLLPPARAQVASCHAHPEGGSCVAYLADSQSLISGGERGELSVFDIRQRRQRCRWVGHSLAVKSLAVHEPTSLCFSASADGDIKLWELNRPPKLETSESTLRGHWTHAHEPHAMLQPILGTTLGRTYGVNQILLDGNDRLLSAGADGKVKLWALERAYGLAR